jgi:hypothetical protein
MLVQYVNHSGICQLRKPQLDNFVNRPSGAIWSGLCSSLVVSGYGPILDVSPGTGLAMACNAHIREHRQGQSRFAQNVEML